MHIFGVKWKLRPCRMWKRNIIWHKTNMRAFRLKTIKEKRIFQKAKIVLRGSVTKLIARRSICTWSTHNWVHSNQKESSFHLMYNMCISQFNCNSYRPLCFGEEKIVREGCRFTIWGYLQTGVLNSGCVPIFLLLTFDFMLRTSRGTRKI
jgi:hypothetical protein